ncbi:MAG: AMP-binding protein [Lentisphaerales bacterium]|nr:AMP-binding protein [Lentisphaerales bacterium]
MNDTSLSYHDFFQRFFRTDKAVSKEHLKVLEKSWNKHREFWTPYWDEHKQNRLFKSHLWQSYDFFHDAVIRHCTDSEAVAFRSFEGLQGWSELTYVDLAKKSSDLAANWEHQGLTEEHSVCIVLPFGAEFIVYLMAAFKMGLSITWLLPEAPDYIHNRLSELEVDYILCSSDQKHFLHDFLDKIMTPHNAVGLAADLISNGYSPEKAAISLFDPINLDNIAPLPIKSEFLFLQTLRDGHLFMDLGPGKTFAAPGFKPLMTEPVQLLATLINGATYVHIDLETFFNSHEEFDALDTSTLAVSRELRDLLLEKEFVLKNNRFWYYNSREHQHTGIWQEFFVLQQDDERFCGNLFLSAADGGALIYSEKGNKLIPLQVFPVPGIPFASEHIVLNGITSNSALSMLVQTDERLSTARPPSVMLHKQNKKWMFSGNHPRSLDSIYLSLDEIMPIVNQQAPNCQAILFEINDSWKGFPSRALLIFAPHIGPLPNGNQLERDIPFKVKEALGEIYSIDHIEYFPFLPPMDGDEIDRRNCIRQFQMGILQKKKQLHFFQETTNLKRLINEL